MYIIFKYLNMLIVRGKSELLLTYSIQGVWAAVERFTCSLYNYTQGKEDTVTNNQCLSFLGIALRHTHTAAPQLVGWSYNALNPKCHYVDTKTSENTYYFFYIFLKFPDHKPRLQLFVRTLVYFLTLPFHSKS